ncbi:MAG: hypothetical protein V4617_15235 [Gemmatimonadota bacterium]
MLLNDDDLLLGMEAIRRDLRNPPPRDTSLFGLNSAPSTSSLIAQLACMQEELDYRLREKERGATA